GPSGVAPAPRPARRAAAALARRPRADEGAGGSGGSSPMIGEELAPGLRRWGLHPQGGGQGGGCALGERGGALCLMDPPLPSGRVSLPKRSQLHVLISVYWHTRDAGDVLRAHTGTLWAPSGGRAAVARRAAIEPKTFRPGDELPAGIEALATSRGSEVVF